MKRLFDSVASLLGLLVLSPVLVVTALAVVLDDGMPFLFLQQRVGLNGKPFRLFKFRTMTQLRGTEQGSFDAGSARRVTRTGQFLRAWKIDELPQLWNVLIGEMSLVGPRPEVRQWVEAYPDRWAGVLSVRPGITDPASIAFRNEEETLAASLNPERLYRETILPHKLDLYARYVQSRTFWGDLLILFKTACAVVAKTPKSP